jgi:hypothetical protein
MPLRLTTPALSGLDERGYPVGHVSRWCHRAMTSWVFTHGIHWCPRPGLVGSPTLHHGPWENTDPGKIAQPLHSTYTRSSHPFLWTDMAWSIHAEIPTDIAGCLCRGNRIRTPSGLKQVPLIDRSVTPRAIRRLITLQGATTLTAG